LYNRSVLKAKFTAEDEKLQVLRLDAGLTQAELAERVGQSQSFVSKYESGERRLDVLELRRICGALGLGLTDFVRRLEESLP
jgi:transcriptional regulator with XRE-family HTH domain